RCVARRGNPLQVKFLEPESLISVAGCGCHARFVRFSDFDRHIAVEMESQRTSSAHRTWDLPDSAVTPEACYLRRREFLRVFGLGLAASALLPPGIQAESGTLKRSAQSVLQARRRETHAGRSCHQL